jgi:hypothetical protein
MSTPYPLCLECRQTFVKTRGLCGRCYGRLRARVKAGKATWQQLEKARKCLPAAKPGGQWGQRRDRRGTS